MCVPADVYHQLCHETSLHHFVYHTFFPADENFPSIAMRVEIEVLVMDLEPSTSAYQGCSISDHWFSLCCCCCMKPEGHRCTVPCLVANSICNYQHLLLSHHSGNHSEYLFLILWSTWFPFLPTCWTYNILYKWFFHIC